MSEAPLFWRDATAENDFCPAHGLDSSADFPPDRAATPRRLQNAPVLLLGSVSVPGLRPTDLSGELARHRSLPALAVFAALPLGDSRLGFPQHAGSRQRASSLADVCRSGRASHRQSPTSLRGPFRSTLPPACAVIKPCARQAPPPAKIIPPNCDVSNFTTRSTTAHLSS